VSLPAGTWGWWEGYPMRWRRWRHLGETRSPKILRLPGAGICRPRSSLSSVGLPRAVRPEQPEDPSLLHGKAGAIHGDDTVPVDSLVRLVCLVGFAIRDLYAAAPREVSRREKDGCPTRRRDQPRALRPAARLGQHGSRSSRTSPPGPARRTPPQRAAGPRSYPPTHRMHHHLVALYRPYIVRISSALSDPTALPDP